MNTNSRCDWAGTDPANIAYHDHEWGIPVHDDVRLFELLTLEGAQAGLSWLTILRKRDGYRQAFAGFDPQHGLPVSTFSESSAWPATLTSSGIGGKLNPQ